MYDIRKLIIKICFKSYTFVMSNPNIMFLHNNFIYFYCKYTYLLKINNYTNLLVLIYYLDVVSYTKKQTRKKFMWRGK